jgi:hypothetical protein
MRQSAARPSAQTLASIRAFDVRSSHNAWMNSTQRLWNGNSRGLAATIALSMWTTLCADAHAAATRIRLSDGTPAQLRSAPTADPVALDIDVATLDAATTEAYLHAIDDRRRSKGLVFAIAGEARDGAAIVALACDGLLLLPGGALVGADGAWCDSASMREDLSEDLRQLGRLDGPLASRPRDHQVDIQVQFVGQTAAAAGHFQQGRGALGLHVEIDVAATPRGACSPMCDVLTAPSGAP